MSFEIVGALETVDRLIAMHRGTLQQIQAGKKFHKANREVTSELYRACTHELRQLDMARDALKNMSTGNLAQARNLLDQIKEFLPDAD